MGTRFKMIKEYPAYDVVTFDNAVEHVVYDNEVLTGESHLDNWLLGSVTEYAIKNGRDPISAYNKAVENGDETHYAMAMGACLTAHKQEKGRRILVNYGDYIVFHGQKFVVEKAHNRNIKLKKAA